MAEIFAQSNLTRIKQGHKKLIANTTTAIAEVVAEAGAKAVGYAKQYPRFTPRSGNLQSKNDWRSVRVAGGRILRVRNTAKYAAAIDKGARPHDISASRKPYLHFLGKRGWVRKKRVKHPGNRPYRFLYGATQVAGKLLQSKLEMKMSRIARSFN